MDMEQNAAALRVACQKCFLGLFWNDFEESDSPIDFQIVSYQNNSCAGQDRAQLLNIGVGAASLSGRRPVAGGVRACGGNGRFRMNSFATAAARVSNPQK